MESSPELVIYSVTVVAARHLKIRQKGTRNEEELGKVEKKVSKASAGRILWLLVTSERRVAVFNSA